MPKYTQKQIIAAGLESRGWKLIRQHARHDEWWHPNATNRIFVGKAGSYRVGLFVSKSLDAPAAKAKVLRIGREVLGLDD